MDQVTVGGGAASSSGGPFTLGLPEGEPGDLLTAWLYASTATAPDTPSGWTLQQTLGSNPTTGLRRQHLYWRKRLDGDADVTWTIGGYTGGWSAIVANFGACRVPGDDQGGLAFFFNGSTTPGSPHIRVYSAQTLETVLDVLNVWSFFAEAALSDHPTPNRPSAGFEKQIAVNVDSEYQTLWVRESTPRVDTLVDGGVTIRGASQVQPHWPRCRRRFWVGSTGFSR